MMRPSGRAFNPVCYNIPNQTYVDLLSWLRKFLIKTEWLEKTEQLFFVLLLARSHSLYCLNLDVSSKARPKDCAAVNEREDNI